MSSTKGDYDAQTLPPGMVALPPGVVPDSDAGQPLPDEASRNPSPPHMVDSDSAVVLPNSMKDDIGALLNRDSVVATGNDNDEDDDDGSKSGLAAALQQRLKSKNGGSSQPVLPQPTEATPPPPPPPPP